MNKIWFAFMCLFSIDTFSSTPATASSFSFVGVAHDVKSNQILYQESHSVVLNDERAYKTSSVQYTDEAGQIFANKSLDFTDSLLAPDVYFNDTRVGTSVKVDSKKSALTVNYQSASDRAEAVIKTAPMMVVDAGFDQMLLKYWDKVLNQQSLDFEFLAPTRAEFISFTLTPISQNKETIRFRLAPSNFVLRLLVDPIMLTYDKSTKRILIYEGLTNIEEVKQGKPTGDYYVARIEYEY
jgi:hypothetical protein